MVLASNILFGGVVCLAAVAPLASPPAADNDALRAAAELHARYAAELEKLAAWCEQNGLAQQAQKTRRVVSPSDPYKLYVPVLPVEVGPHSQKLPADAPAKVVEWDARLSKLRRDHAVALYEMAHRAVRIGRVGLAFDLAMAAIQADPDCEPVRRLLGYQKFRGQWRTPYEIKKLQAGFVRSERFGWLPEAHLRRYEAGQRYCDGRWISAEKDAQRHRNIHRGWDVETEHYTIRTNHSIEAAVALGVKLERLYRLWRRLFIRYYASRFDVAALFDGRFNPAFATPRRHDVVLFRDRNDYNRWLRATMPKIGISVGTYVAQTRRAYFFVARESDDRTLYHEAAHQLFYESRPVAQDVVQKANFWIVEGIAMFLETLRQKDGYYVLGGRDDERMHAACYRLLHDRFYVPLNELVGYSMERLQEDPRIAMLYSQAAGLTNFLIFFDGGRYRDVLVSYLVAVYTGRDGHDTLSKLTGENYEELDAQYRKFMEAMAADPAA